MTQPTVLISGAGIAGPSLAFWLTRNGYRVVVVEIAPGIRPGGQTVDLRGAGGDVVERMGLLDQMRDRALEQHGAAWVRSDGSRRAEMPVTAFKRNGIVSKLEILRGDLVDVLYQATKDAAAYRFNTRIDRMSQNDTDIAMNTVVWKWMQAWPIRPLAAKLWFAAADSIDLPDYSSSPAA